MKRIHIISSVVLSSVLLASCGKETKANIKFLNAEFDTVKYEYQVTENFKIGDRFVQVFIYANEKVKAKTPFTIQCSVAVLPEKNVKTKVYMHATIDPGLTVGIHPLAKGTEFKDLKRLDDGQIFPLHSEGTVQCYLYADDGSATGDTIRVQ